VTGRNMNYAQTFGVSPCLIEAMHVWMGVVHGLYYLMWMLFVFGAKIRLVSSRLWMTTSPTRR
jgi:hypothetical protein